MSRPLIAWTHEVHDHMDCPDDGDMSSGTSCRHTVDLDGLRKRAQDYLDSFGAGNWGRDDDVWIDILRPSTTTAPEDAILMGRFIFAVSPDAILAVINALENQRPAKTTGNPNRLEVITTVDQLDALPGAVHSDSPAARVDGAVIKSKTGAIYEKNADGTWATDGAPHVPGSSIALHALLLWSPAWQGEASTPGLRDIA